MKLPRYRFNPTARFWFILWRKERVGRRQEQRKLERQLLEWQNKLLSKVNVEPLYHVPPPPVKLPEPPPIGITQLRAREARKEGNGQATEEEILAAVERVHGHR